MLRVLDAHAMQALDARAVHDAGDVTLMRLAAKAIAALIPMLSPGRTIAGVAGPGNNGGDVFAAFAELDAAYTRTVIELPPATPSAARTDARERALASGVTVVPPSEAANVIAEAGLCLDGILGVGARLPLGANIAELARRLQRHPNVLAIDVPTGVDASTGEVDEAAVRAHATIALGALKTGLFAESARAFVGELWFDAIGIDAGAYDAPAQTVTLTEAEAARLMPVRPAAGDKRDAGAPLILAGSEQFPGAAVLCGRAAARAGAGYVTIATPAAAAPALRAHLVEQVVVTFDDRDPAHAIETIAGLAGHCSSLAIGPGLGLSDSLGEIVRGVLRKTTLPAVVDAGGLFHLSKNLDVLRGKRVALTPHAREFARLSGKGTIAPGERAARLRAFTTEHEAVTLLKGQTTLVDDGKRLYLNPSGTNALATAGTGDVLSGIIATLLAQGLAPFEAASLGAYWHGLAGQLAHAWRPIGVVAGDVIDALADAAPAANDPMPGPIRIF